MLWLLPSHPKAKASREGPQCGEPALHYLLLLPKQACRPATIPPGGAHLLGAVTPSSGAEDLAQGWVCDHGSKPWSSAVGLGGWAGTGEHHQNAVGFTQMLSFAQVSAQKVVPES